MLTEAPWLHQKTTWGTFQPGWLEQLQYATQLYSRGEDYAFAAMFHAVTAAIHRLEYTEEAAENLEPLRALQLSLDKANSGRSVPGFRARGRIQKDGISGGIECIAVHSSDLLFAAFKREHGARGRADKEAAQILAGHGLVSFQGKLITSDMVRQWRSIWRGQEPLWLRQWSENIPDDITLEAARDRINQIAARAAAYPALNI